MKPLSCFKGVISSALAALAVGCSSGVDTGPATVVRTPPPQAYEKTITDYLAFKIRTPQKNAEINIGAPEPGACALDAYTTSSRGWVVPVAYATRSGEATGKETIRINAKQYYFWFLGNTIAGITPRLESCPGVGTSFEMPPVAAAPIATPTAPARASADAQPRDEVAPVAAKTTSGQKRKAAAPAKKNSATSGKAKPPATPSQATGTTTR